jgi:hypothetical protein
MLGSNGSVCRAFDHQLNVLFRGRHGVGKTSIVKAGFDHAGLRWRYFSVPTGKPEQIFDDESVEALFFDDFDRMPKKFRSVVMGLLRHKSDRLPNLKIVWAAVSVDDDDDFDLEQFDPAQADRFHVTVEIPFKPHLPYFTQVYDERVAEAAVAWWAGLPEELRSRVSPRRLDLALSKVKGVVPELVGGELEAAVESLRP